MCSRDDEITFNQSLTRVREGKRYRLDEEGRDGQELVQQSQSVRTAKILQRTTRRQTANKHATGDRHYPIGSPGTEQT
jgi:hypothetical protein